MLVVDIYLTRGEEQGREGLKGWQDLFHLAAGPYLPCLAPRCLPRLAKVG